ncbi:MAG: Flp pilus assembly complex ATPase component TadA [Phycisphaeraceae bacterium]|nr:Flp pilus assembly complex ATPase component TadA [Phycisphaeraceae bacterium]
MARSRKKIGEILVGWGMAKPEQIDKAMQAAKASNKRLGDALVDMGVVKEEQVAKALAFQFGLPYYDLKEKDNADKINRELVPEELQRKHLILPIEKQNGRLKLVISDPMNLEMLDALRFRLSTEIDPVIGAKSLIKSLLEAGAGGGEGGATAALQQATGGSLITASIDKSLDKSIDASIDRDAQPDAPIIKLCNRMIIEAVQNRASDIHIEPMADRVRIRYRIDGVCIERDNLPKRMQNAVLTRIKLMAGVNIAEKRIPQDGRIKLPVGDSVVDFRVSACPIYHGESVVLRILRPDSVRIGLENLGFEEETLEIFHRIIKRPNGIFLVTGPTGSGKTTTLYTALDLLNRPDKKIITAEDPIEYAFTGINQCQVRESIGLSFQNILRAMLRQAPNIILVGEIRDKEVAEVAIQAALTGHLVFSTLHTNDAPSAMTRLIDMGVKPFLVASSIQAVLAQRLVRVLCKECKELDNDPEPKMLRLVGLSRDEAVGKVYKPVGCPKCNGTGFRGRRAIFEMMMMTNELRDLAFKQAPVSQLRRAAIASGMKTLLDDGKRKILKGFTTPEEIAKFAQTAVDMEVAEA